MKTLSVALAVYNEAQNLTRVLNSVKDIAQEIVVVDGGSTDKTVEIAKQFGVILFETDNPPIFHINKQKALDACTGKWILQLDADEVIPDSLKIEIVKIVEEDKQEYAGFYIPRRNNFWGHWMKKTGVYPDYAIRLFKNGKGKFPCKSVHELIEIDGKIGYLENPMLHYSYETMKDYWRKADTYTSLTAADLGKRRIPKNIYSIMEYFFIFPLKTFFTLFIRNQGFIDGIYGFLFSVFSAFHHPISYWKYLKMT
jgi:glycosyltransferase involved in cell wall biosynthesis